jgi:hypothetical protein
VVPPSTPNTCNKKVYLRIFNIVVEPSVIVLRREKITRGSGNV